MTTVRTCRECGCTDDNACVIRDAETGAVEDACLWVESDLCCACTPTASKLWEHPTPESIEHARQIREGLDFGKTAEQHL